MLQNHKVHLENIATDASLISNCGVRCRSPFDVLNSFEAVESLPPDIMHDHLEGVIPLTMKLVIEFLTNENFMTKESFQIAMQQFTFEKNDCKNKPDAWIRGTSYSLTASQSWCLFRSLPFIVENFVPIDCKVWELYLLLSKICDIVFALSFSMSWISYLDSLIHDFYFMFISIAPNKIIPKCHFLLHYPRLMIRFGPLRFLWCMRFEAYHQRIKKLQKEIRTLKIYLILWLIEFSF